MALRINTNASSLMAQRQLGIQNAGLQKAMERLSSGLRINRAADDAAGLAISDGMTAQIKGYYQAYANVQDAINLTQTGEGGLGETTNLLNRMRELAVQAANDTYTQPDRAKIQTEIEQLTQELDRIAVTTQFNNRTLLDGSIGYSSSQVDATFSIMQNTRVGGPDPNAVPVFGDLISGVSVTNAVAASVDVSVETKVVATATAGVFDMEIRGSDGSQWTLNNITGSLSGPGGAANNIFNSGLGAHTFNQTLLSGGQISITWGTVAVTTADIGDVATLQLQGKQDAKITDQALTFHIGQNEGQILKFGIADTRSGALHLEGVSVLGTTDQHSRQLAQNMIGVLDEALRKVNTQRSRMGSLQNRLEHAAANSMVAMENLSASQSRIRDTDVALESAALTRQQILTQAGTAMLAQANSAPQNALSLLRG
jgi:flagellin